MMFHTKLRLVQKPLRNNYKVDGFARDYGGTKYLVLFCHEKNDYVYDRNRYLKGLKSGIAYAFSHKYDDDMLLEETLTLRNVAIFIKSVFNRNQNHYYFNLFLEKWSC